MNLVDNSATALRKPMSAARIHRGFEGQFMTNYTTMNIHNLSGLCCLLLLGGCLSGGGAENTPTTAGAATTLVKVSGDNQSAAPGSTLTQPLVVKVTDAAGSGVANVSVEFFTESPASFAGKMNETQLTDSSGQASVQYRLGTTGIYHALARVPLLNNAKVSFAATASGADPAFIATVPAGKLPQGIGVDTANNRIYAGNNGNQNGCDFMPLTPAASNTMTAIDGATLTAQTVTVGSSPIYPVPNPVTGRVYVANSGQGTVSVVNGADNTLIATIANTGPAHQGAVDTANNEIWMNDSSGHRALVISGTDNTIITSVATSQLGPHGLGFNPVTGRIYTTNVEGNTVTVIDRATRSKLKDIALPTSALGIAVNSVTNKIYIGTSLYKKIVVINGANDAVSEINVGRHVLELTVDETNNRIYATSQSLPYSVAVIDGSSDTLLGFYPVGACPWGVAVDPSRNRLYITQQGEDSVRVLDTSKISFP